MGEDDLGPVEVNLLALLDWSLENGNAQAARVLRHCFNKIEERESWPSRTTRESEQSKSDDAACRVVLREVLTLKYPELNTLDAIFQYVVQLPSRLIRQKKIAAHSYVGSYLRGVALRTKLMGFSRMMEVFGSWIKHYGSSLTAHSPRSLASPHFEDLDRSNVAFSVHHVDDRYVPVSKVRLLAADSMHLTTLHNQSDTSRKIALDSIYVSFLRAWKRGDYSSALALSSRYFDFSNFEKGKASYQYALLNLALLQSEFECSREALRIIYETMDAARDHQDDTCLNFALSWYEEVSWTGHFVNMNLVQNDDHRECSNWQIDQGDSLAVSSLVHCQSDTGYSVMRTLSYSIKQSVGAAAGISTDQYLLLATIWTQLDVCQLSNVALRIAMGSAFSNSASDAQARLRSRVAQMYWQNNRDELALRFLHAGSRELRSDRAYQRVIRVQEARFHLARGNRALFTQMLDTFDHDRDPTTIAAYVRYLVTNQHLSEAWSIVALHLGPERQRMSQSVHLKVLYLRLQSELFNVSALGVTQAILLCAQALQLAHQNALFKDCRELKQQLKMLISTCD